MSALMDDISRIIASPISRREAFRLVGGAVGGAVLASLGLGRATRGLGAAVKCPPDQVVCDTICCHRYELCCGGTCYGGTVNTTYSCCGIALCLKSYEKCCTDHCCRKTQTCCGSSCCAAGTACCNGKCCAAGAVCCAGRCCPPGDFCCGDRCVANRPSSSAPCTAA